MKLNYICIKLLYDNTYDRFELESKPGREAGKLRRYIAWPFITFALAILFGMDGYRLLVNGRIMEKEEGEN